MTRYPVTPEGYAALVAELANYKEVVRPQIVRDIEEARAHGDISENSEYEDAKERQAHCEGRIAELEGRVASADIIDVTKLPKNDRVIFGCTVVIENGNGERRTWRIVGEDEASVESGTVSYKSPLGKALIGKNEGDETVVPAPSGNQNWEIVEVHYR
ncbi:MAG: transcription elongation factor GreA [Alphaproteobacteria bacterium]|nr:transcription elongation factor GreA [Alphaproteobacteria bacterium]MCB9698245.1 transcription elongation factor GreA [Alphaproteobacteria bacterium]